MYFDQTSEEPGTDNLYLVRIYGSTSANTVWVGNEVAVGFSGSNLQAGAQAGNLYKGGDVVGVLDPANGTPDGAYAAIMPNTAPWAPGDSVENANNISANYYSYYDNAVVNNPFATRVMHYENWFGYGGGAGASSGWGYFSNDAGNNYVGAGGKFYAPYLLGAQGYISEGLFSQYAPLTGPQSVASLGCAPGFMIAICNGPAPGATTTVEGIFQPDGNHGDEFVYDHATRAWEFVGPGGAVLNGSPICTGGGSCSLLSIAASGTTNGTISFGGNAGADALDLFAYGSNKYGWGLNGGEMQFFVQDDTTDHFSFSGAAGGLQPTGTNEFARLTPRTSGGGWSLASGEGYGWSSSATSSATVATQLTQPSAGNISLDTTTPGNHAASLTLNNLTVDGVYLGPATAPTGSCPTNGAWAFSQDGHATFCAAGAWTAKI